MLWDLWRRALCLAQHMATVNARSEVIARMHNWSICCRKKNTFVPLFCSWTVTTWPASLGSLCWPSCPAGATLEGCLACFALRARGPSRFHASRLPGLRYSAGLMAHQTVTDTTFTLFYWTASSVVTRTQTFTNSIFH